MTTDKLQKIDNLIKNLKINDLTNYISKSLKFNRNSYQKILDYCNSQMMKEVEKLFSKHYEEFDFKNSKKPRIETLFYKVNLGFWAAILGDERKENNLKLCKYVENNRKVILDFYKAMLEDEKIEAKQNAVKVCIQEGIEELEVSEYPNCQILILPSSIKKITNRESWNRKFDSKIDTIYYNGDLDSWFDIETDINSFSFANIKRLFFNDEKIGWHELEKLDLNNIKNKKIEVTRIIISNKLKSLIIPNDIELKSESYYSKIHIKNNIELLECSTDHLKKMEICGEITNLKFNGNAKLDYNVFPKLKKIKNLYLPSTTLEIYDYAFQEDVEIDYIFYEENVEKWLSICSETCFEYINRINIKALYILDSKNKYVDMIKEIYKPIISEKNYRNYSSFEIKKDYKKRYGRYSDYNYEHFNTLTVEDHAIGIKELPFKNSIVNDINRFEKIILTNSKIEWISKKAFENHKYLKSLYLPLSLKIIEESAFLGCDNINELYYKGTINDWANIVFKDKYSNPAIYAKKIIFNQANEIKISNNKIGAYQFYNLDMLNEAKLLEGVEIIEESAFEKCSNLKELYLPSTIKTIEKNAFRYCNNLTNVIFEGSISQWEKINFADYYSNPSIYSIKIYFVENEKEVDISNIIVGINDDTIKQYQYCGFKDLRKIEIKDGVKKIQQYAFANCEGLLDIVLPKSLEEIDSNAFKMCKNIVNVYYKGTFDEWKKIDFKGEFSNPLSYAKNIYFYDEEKKGYEIFEDYKIKEGVEEINCDLIKDIPNIKTIYIPKSTIIIYKDVFKNCSNINKVYYGGTITQWKEIIFENTYSNPMYFATIMYFYNEDKGKYEDFKKLIITDSTFEIDSIAALCLKSIEELEIGEENIKLKNGIFSVCNSLKKLIIPCGYNLNDLGIQSESLEKIIFNKGDRLEYILSNLNNLKEIIIPSSIKCIEKNVFSLCKNLKKVYFDGTLFEWCNINFLSLFSNPMCCAEKLYLKNELGDFYLLVKLSIPDLITRIGNYQFYNLKQLQKVFVNSNVLEMGESCFEGCSNLLDISLSSALLKIENKALSNCKSLRNIVLPKSICFIGDKVFDGCENVEEITLPGLSCLKENPKLLEQKKQALLDSRRILPIFQYKNEDIVISWNSRNRKFSLLNLDEFDEHLSNDFLEGCNPKTIYYTGTIRDLYLMKKSQSSKSILNTCEKVYIKNEDEKWDLYNYDQLVKNEITTVYTKLFEFDSDLNYQCLKINIDNCFISIFKNNLFIDNNKNEGKGLWKIAITCLPTQLESKEKIIDIVDAILDEIKEKYAFLLIRSDIYISISTLLLEERFIDSVTYYYTDNYEIKECEVKELKNKPHVLSVQDIDEEFTIIEERNTDAINCVKAFTNTLDIYELTQEKIDSIFEIIDNSIKQKTKERILIEGPARSGKTIIAFKLLEKYSKSKFLLMNYYFYRAIKDAFNAYNVEFPSNRIYHHDIRPGRSYGCSTINGDRSNGWRKSFVFDLDFLIVDEAQRLSNLPGNQGRIYYFPGFDELDLILKDTQTAILLGDDMQRLNPKYDNFGFKSIKSKLNNLSLDYYFYHFSETIGIPTHLVNSIKYILYNDERYKDHLNGFNISLTCNIGEFVNEFKKENTNKKHFVYVPIPNVYNSYDDTLLSRYNLSFYPIEEAGDYFLNSSIQNKYLFSTYEMISRELEVVYLYIPKSVTYSDNFGINDSSYSFPQDFLLNHLYVNMTRATKKLVIFTSDSSLLEYLNKQIAILNNESVEKRWNSLIVEKQKINYVLSYSDKKKMSVLQSKLKELGFEGFIHCTTLNNAEKILISDQLKSRTESDGIFNDIADQGVISITNEFVKKHVRFYLKTNTPTLYHFEQEHNDLVMFIFDFDLLNEYEFYFSDGNAASKYTRITGCLSEILEFDWFTVFSRGPVLGDKEEIIRKRNAELLIDGPVQISKYLRFIYVKDDKIANILKQKFPQYANIIIIKDKQST